MKLLSVLLLAAVAIASGPNNSLLQDSIESAGAPDDVCNVACAEIYAPVCGSDGVTYSNECTFRIEQCRRSFDTPDALAIVKTGECLSTQCNGFLGTQCPEGYDCVDVPNDGCDPENGDSDCIGECFEIAVEPDEDLCLRACPRVFDPVCGSDGATYPSPCEFEVENCFRSMENLVALTSTPGECSRIPCGDFVGRPCPEGFECIDVPDDGCDPENGDADCLGECFELAVEPDEDRCFQFCTFEYDPVCGSDGVTYSNPCEFDVTNCYRQVENLVALTSTPGACPGPDFTEMPQRPAEGPDFRGQGGDNEEPPQDPCELFCTLDIDPVCGSDGVTYSNPCFFDIANCYRRLEGVTALSSTPGACATDPGDEDPCPQVCSADFDPVCGSDGSTYANPCLLGVENCFRQLDGVSVLTSTPGECPELPGPDQVGPDATEPVGPDAPQETEEQPCPRFCPMIFNPVCGSDGVTYSNPCFFDIENCNRQRGNLVALTSTFGACPDPEPPVDAQVGPDVPVEEREPCGELCALVFDPVCGSDGVQYSNACFFDQENCRRRLRRLVALTSTPGRCPEPECEQPCTKELNPVCGSDGRTYNNPCMFKNAACKLAKSNSKAPALISRPGRCPPKSTATTGIEKTRSPRKRECFLRPETGPCRAAIPRWFYNPKSGECEEFIYGGCRGNANNFLTEAECEPACETEAPVVDNCDQGCFTLYAPVCGSDGVTYSNECMFNVANCKKRGVLSIATMGECPTPDAKKGVKARPRT